MPLSLFILTNVPIPQAGFVLLTFAGGTLNFSHKGVPSGSASPTSMMSFSTSAAVGEDKVASSCPSNWLKEGNLPPLPTDTTRRCPSEAGGEGRRLRGLRAFSGALELGQEERLLVQEKQDSIQSHSVGKKRLALLLQQPLQLDVRLLWLET